MLSIFSAFEDVKAAINGMHPRGGYRVSCIIPGQAFDAVMRELEKNGWFSAI